MAIPTGVVLGKATDRNQPMNLDADTTDCAVDDAGGPCLFTGNVHIVQGTLDVRAARADVRRAAGDIQRVLLTGSPVLLKQQLENGSVIDARASNVEYDLPKDTVTFTGGVRLDQPGRGAISGERIVYNMRTGQVQGGGGGAGQVRTTILPKSAKPAGDGK
ncbi:MAG TPA: lipopolysaccharide transport periplasmic protein LptA [Luteimonas sp.]|nr:lipopolysaccharide transport periplasmic protein LptA [Luteimonas sp.]